MTTKEANFIKGVTRKISIAKFNSKTGEIIIDKNHSMFFIMELMNPDTNCYSYQFVNKDLFLVEKGDTVYFIKYDCPSLKDDYKYFCISKLGKVGLTAVDIKEIDVIHYELGLMADDIRKKIY